MCAIEHNNFAKFKIGISKFVAIAFLLGLMIQLAGCSSTNNELSEDMQLSIAVMGSKQVYDYDTSFLNGIEMAINDFNQQYSGKGFSATYKIYDDEYDFEKGVVIAKKLSSDPKITAVIGSHSFNILDASVDFFEDSKKILIAANGMMDKSIVNKKYKYIFRNTFGETEMGASMADHAAKIGADRIAIYHSNTEFENNMGMAFSKRALENDLKVLDDVSEIGSQKDFDNIFKRWEAIGINCVMISQESIADAFMSAERIRTRSDKIKIYGDFSFDAEEKLMENKEFVEGIIIPTLVPVRQSKALEGFDARYEEIYGSVPTWWAAHAYDSVRMVLDTAVLVNSNIPEKIAEGLHSETGYQGIIGKITFDKSGLLANISPEYSIVEDGRLVNLKK